MKPETATKLPQGWPYSILTNLEHADFWQRVWLARLEGKPRPQWEADWRVPDESEFESVRASFLGNFKRAAAIVESWPRDHGLKSDDEALHSLVSLAVHNAYHIGQIKLMARILSASTEPQSS